MIIISDGCIAFITLLLAAAFMLDYDYIWLMFFVLVTRGFGSEVQVPAVNAVMPALVPKNSLTKINGVYNSSQSITNLMCPIVSGVLLTAMSIGYVF